MASESEEEYGALFINSILSLPLRMDLENLNHPQPPAPLYTDNMTEKGFANEELKWDNPNSWT